MINITEDEIKSIIDNKLSNSKYTLKTILIACGITFILGCILGVYITKVHFPTLNTEVKTIKDTVLIKGDTITDTKLQYVKGETVYLPAPAQNNSLATPVSKDTPGATPTKLDGKFDISKNDFNYMINGKVGKFTKTDDEKFIFDKGMLDLKQTSTITIQAEIPTMDLTRHNVVTIGGLFADGKVYPAVGYTGSVGKIGAYQLVGAKNGGYVGAGIKF